VLHAYAKSAVAQLPTISLSNQCSICSKKCYIIANCAKSVSIKESLPLKMHTLYMYIYFWQWIVSWQICVASLPESVTWVYSRFHRWCNNAWEDGRITSANCTTNLCNMFYKEYSIKLRLLSRTWPNISKLERAVLIFAGFFPRFFPSVGYCKETGMNHRQSCQSAFGSAVKHP